jgi:hypothetical protein
MAAADANIGELLADDREIFRAFADKSFRVRKNPPPHKIRSGAYLLREDDVDGLSVGLTPRDCVRFLERNFGYCSILVGQVRALPYALEVRLDAANPGHAFICNLPLLTISDEHRERAMVIAGELARRSHAITCDPFVPNGCAAPVPQE